ncbi:MAG: acetyltransferase [Clostridia bacterium]|nr:acetyltransferase [Clostridia bacterium]
MKNIVLYGASGFGKEVAYIIERINDAKPTYNLLGFIDDGTKYCNGVEINGYPWLGRVDWILDHKEECLCTCTIGYSKTKAQIQQRLKEQGVRFETIIAPDARLSPLCTVGAGSVIYGYTSISVNCTIGEGVLLNGRVSVGHDVEIGSYTTVMVGTGISGGCKIGSEVSIGGHAFILPERIIGDGATVAAGSVVFTNVKAGMTVLGNPAKRMKELE